MKKCLIIPIIGLVWACAKEPSPEEMGQQMLNQARSAYARGEYAAARDTILSLRKRFPTAIEARRQAIFLMDSVEYQLAEGDSIKAEFYRRKLEHDKHEYEIRSKN